MQGNRSNPPGSEIGQRPHKAYAIDSAESSSKQLAVRTPYLLADLSVLSVTITSTPDGFLVSDAGAASRSILSSFASTSHEALLPQLRVFLNTLCAASGLQVDEKLAIYAIAPSQAALPPMIVTLANVAAQSAAFVPLHAELFPPSHKRH